MSVLKNVDQGISTNDSKYIFDFQFEMDEELKRMGDEADEKEREKDRLKKERKNTVKLLTSFLKNLYMGTDVSLDKFCQGFGLSREECKKYIEEITSTDYELVKNKKDLGKKFVKNDINRNLFNELEKNTEDKDISLLEEKLINLIYEDSKEEIKVDYRSNFYILEAGKLKRILEIESEKYKFLINLEKLSEQLIKAFELVRREVIGGCHFSLVEILYFNYISGEILPRIKYGIIYEKDRKIRFYKYLLLCLHVHYVINEEKSYLKMLYRILDLNLTIPIEKAIMGTEDIRKNSFLEKAIYNGEYKRDNFFMDKIKAIEVFHLTSNDRIKMILYNREDFLTPQLIAAYYRGIYLSDIKYKGKKLSSYLENYRKAEFILKIHEKVESKTLTKSDYEAFKKFYLTKNEAENKFSQKKNEDIHEEVIDPYSVEKEENFVRAIVKIGNSRKKFEEKIDEMYAVTSKYVEIKKNYGEFFQENTAIKRDVMTFINYLFYFFYMANLNSGTNFAKEKVRKFLKIIKNLEYLTIYYIVRRIEYQNILFIDTIKKLEYKNILYII